MICPQCYVTHSRDLYIRVDGPKKKLCPTFYRVLLCLLLHAGILFPDLVEEGVDSQVVGALESQP